MSKGWIKLHRTVLQWEHFKEGSVLKVFLALLCNADRDGKTDIKLDELMENTGMSHNTVNMAIAKLVKSGEITREKRGQNIYTTISNWSEYQENPSTQNLGECNDSLTQNLGEYNDSLTQNLKAIHPKNGTIVHPKNGTTIYNKKDNKNEQEEIVVANAHTREVFVANALTDLAVEKGCMAMRITPERYRQLVTEVITDWEFTQLPEREWTLTHLLSQMRIKNSINNRNNGQQNQQSTERGNGAVHTVSGFKILNRQ